MSIFVPYFVSRKWHPFCTLNPCSRHKKYAKIMTCFTYNQRVYAILILLIFPISLPVTHWTKNEHGQIIPVTDSYFAVKSYNNPDNHLYDLLDQIEDYKTLKFKKIQLAEQKLAVENNNDVINTKTHTHETIEVEHYKNHPQCQYAEKKLEKLSFHIPLALSHYIPFPLIKHAAITPVYTFRNSTHEIFRPNYEGEEAGENTEDASEPSLESSNEEHASALLPFCNIISPDSKIPTELFFDYSSNEFGTLNTYGKTAMDVPLKDLMAANPIPKRDEVLLMIDQALKNVEMKNDPAWNKNINLNYLKHSLQKMAESLGMVREVAAAHLAHSLTHTITRAPLNKYTWISYEYAALYWQSVNDPINALHCVRKAWIYAKLNDPNFIAYLINTKKFDDRLWQKVLDTREHERQLRATTYETRYLDQHGNEIKREVKEYKEITRWINNFAPARLFPAFQLAHLMVIYDKRTNPIGHMNSEQYHLVQNATRLLTKIYHINEIELWNYPRDYFNFQLFALGNIHLYLQSQIKALELFKDPPP